MTDHARARAAVVAAVLSSLCACRGARAPDVVVITLDTVRADRLGCYGGPTGLTPRLDAFAASGIVFEDASCATPITLPSHATLFTGRYPTHTGVRNNGTFVVPESETTLAERLKERGWRTGAVIAAYPLQSRYGLAQGFDVYDEQLPAIDAKAGGAFAIHFSERDARAVTDRALDVWGRLARGPRFLWVHYFDAHAPYAPPEPYASRHAGAPYDGEIAYVDAELGRLLDRIARDAPQAVIVVASDHGEGLGDHGEKTHGVFLYQSTVHVPLLLRAPGRLPAGRVPAPVTLADVVPTVLGLAGIAAPSGLDGVDLVPAIAGKPLAARDVYAESYLARLQFRFSPLSMLRSGPLKYIEAPAPELYDVRADPAESKNLAGMSADRDAMAARLAADLASEDPGAGERAAGALDAESEARLRSLGYAAAGSIAAAVNERGRDPKSMVDYLARYDRAVGLIASGRIDDGLALLRQLVPEAPENYMARYQLAAGLLASDRAAEALTELDEVVRAAPELGSGHLMRAECLVSLGRLDDALPSFDAAAERLPTQAEPKLALGRALASLGRFDAAAAAFGEAIEREPGSRDAVRALVALRAGRGDLERASTELATLAERFPSSSALAFGLAEVRHRRGDEAGAIEAADRALALAPQDADALLLRADARFASGQPDLAATDYRDALRVAPGSRRADLGLGRCLAVAGPLPEAESYVGSLEARYPADADAIALRGVLAERRGEIDAARRAYRDALAADPRCIEARRGLERIAPAPR